MLRGAFPEARIRWLVNTEWMPLLDGNPHIDEVIEFPRRDLGGLRGSLRIGPWARQLRKRVQPDLILDYQGLLRSGLIAKLCRSKRTQVFGLGDAREGARFFYDKTTDVSDCVHAVDRYLALTREVISLYSTPYHLLSSPLPPGVPPPGFELNEPFVVLHPFSRGAGKSLDQAQIEEFCKALAPIPVVIVGKSNNRVTPAKNVIDLLNVTTLHSLIWLLRKAAFVVSVDSGPMHIAAALDVPLVSIHTWSDPDKVGPNRSAAWVWKDGQVYRQDFPESTRDYRKIRDLLELGVFVRTQLQTLE
jgi:heptosyltransferase I